MNAAFNLSRVTPRRGEVFLVVAVSVLVLVMDLASTTLGDTMKPTMWFSLVLAGLAVTSCFWPVLAGSAVVILSAVAAVLPEDVVTVVNGPLLVMLVVGMWTSRRWYAMAGAVVVMEGVLPYLNGYRADVALMSAAATGLVGGLGGEVAGHLWRRAEGLAVELDAVARQRDLAEARVRADLSEALHDTVCRDLTMLISQCREVAADNDLEIRDGVSRIEGRARDALAHLREVSAVLSVEGRPELRDMALEDVLAECALMLEHRDMTIDAQLGAWDGGEDDDSRDAAFVLGLVLREAMVNILKYAPPGAQVSVGLELAQEETRLTVVSPIGEVPQSGTDPSLTGGLGLASLRRRVESRSGCLSARSLNGRWVVSCSLPPVPESPSVHEVVR